MASVEQVWQDHVPERAARDAGSRLEHAGIVAAAPWLMLIAALILVERVVADVLDADTLSSFRVSLVYTLGLSLAVAAPVASMLSRILSNDLYSGLARNIWPLYLTSMAVGAVLSGLLALMLFGAILQLSAGRVVLSAMACASTTLVWIALSTLSAVKDFRGITYAFALGLAVAVIAAIGLGLMTRSGDWMLFGFNSGLVVTLWVMSLRLLVILPATLEGFGGATQRLKGAFRRHWLLALGALAAATGIWIDKILIWASPFGVEINGGLRHAPVYDSPMFFASLTIIPALAQFSAALEQRFVPLYKEYFDGIARHDTLAEIERNSAALSRSTFDIFSRLVLLQGAGCALVILAAPAIIEMMQFRFHQLAMLRWGCIGMAFYFLFIASASLLVFFERYAWFAGLHISFLLSCGLLTHISLAWGIDYLGIGFMFASAFCGLFSFLILDRTLRDLEFITFIVNNAARSAVT